MNRAGWRNRGISAVAAVCYGLAVTTAGLLHNHHDFDAGNAFGCGCSARGCVHSERPDQQGLPSPLLLIPLTLAHVDPGGSPKFCALELVPEPNCHK